ncbi:hypothetical protein [Steroidobacter cummioxidans]|uniref:hypothetical protein n=1 Tax=Steroidobacter cummioxidans TaxID=1803913 RepID=UPI000E31C6A7|nr:hypothetical protein [Steroidobacter cummioxidans]
MVDGQKIELETNYRMSWANILLLSSIGLVLGVFMLHEARTNTQRLTINGVIELSVGHATVFFWAMSLFMFGLVLLAILAIVQRLRGTNRITITTEGLWIPGPAWSPAQRFHPFSSIESLKVVAVYKSRILQGKTTHSRFGIASQNLSSAEEFERIVALIQQLANRRAS